MYFIFTPDTVCNCDKLYTTKLYFNLVRHILLFFFLLVAVVGIMEVFNDIKEIIMTHKSKVIPLQARCGPESG